MLIKELFKSNVSNYKISKLGNCKEIVFDDSKSVGLSFSYNNLGIVLNDIESIVYNNDGYKDYIIICRNGSYITDLNDDSLEFDNLMFTKSGFYYE